MWVSELYAFILAGVLIALAVTVHFRALQALSSVQNRPGVPGQGRILAIIFGLIAAHIVEALIFAFGYWAGEQGFHLGAFVGARTSGVLHYFYFSLETFTTQGVGDLYAVGPLRLVAALEPLLGLILLGWSTSFTFLVMGRDWRLRARRSVQTAKPHTPSRPHAASRK